MTIPNLLTSFRILLTPLLISLLLDGNVNSALVVFFIAGLTDGLDGLIARVLHQKSVLGAYLDPLADKLLLVTSFLLLGHLGLVPQWLVLIAVSRDVMIVLGLTALIFFAIPVKIKPVFSSKMTTLLQLLTVLAAMASSLAPLPSWAYSVLFVCTALFSIVSGAHYIVIGIGVLESQRCQEKGQGPDFRV